MGLDLILRHVAGQLAPPSEKNVGRHLFQILGTDDPLHPSICAARLASQGEVVPYRSVAGGRTWEATLAPIVHGRRVIGLIGNAFHSSRQMRPWWESQPTLFEAPEDADGVQAGDLVTVPELGDARLHRTVNRERLHAWLRAGLLRPVGLPVASGTSAAGGLAPLGGLPPAPRLRVVR